MTKKENKVFAVVFFAIIFTLMLALISAKVFNRQIKELQRKSNMLTADTININWEELFPYDTVVDEIKNTDTSDEPSSGPLSQVINRYSNRMLNYGSLGSNLAKEMYKYPEIARSGFAISAALTDPSVTKSYIKLNNGYWILAVPHGLTLNDTKNSMAKYASLDNYLKKEGIPFLYWAAPSKVCAWDDELPKGVMHYGNYNIDLYTQALDYYGIENIDMRQVLLKSGLDYYSLFYRTDHHWNIDAGIWAASVIEEEIKRRYDIEMDYVYDLGTFKRTTYENAMFGSIGQGITHFVEKSENFDILYPEFETNFRLEIPDNEIDATGSFEDIFINYDDLEYCINQGGGYAYEQILYGNRPYVKITNLLNTDGPKILMIRDSFSSAAVPYLTLSCSELVLLDTRYFTGSVINCIDSFKPDLVMTLQSFPQYFLINK